MYRISFLSGIISLVSLTACLASASDDGENFSTFTGQRVPAGLIRAVLGSDGAGADINLKELVYEVSEGYLFNGYGALVNIKKETSVVPASSHGFATKRVINGVERTDMSSQTQIRQGKGFSLIQELGSERTLHVFGDNINLKPVDDKRFPGVFVNTLRTRVENVKLRTEQSPVSVDDLDEAALKIGTISNRQAGSCASGSRRYLELAVAYDNTYCAMFSDSEVLASAAVQSLVNGASALFEADLCISIALVHIEAHCNDSSDPYAGISNLSGIAPESRAEHILDSFAEIWRSSREDIYRDAAYFISGFEDDTSTAGIASVGAACGSFGYGWVQKSGVGLLAHELGHTLSASHDSSGIMKSGGSGDDRLSFSAFSISQMVEYVDSAGASCLTSDAPVCDSTCPGGCVDGQCIARHGNVARPGLVPCLPLGSSYKCADMEVIGSAEIYFATECASNFEFVQEETSEAGAFCCSEPSASEDTEVVSTDTGFYQYTYTFNGVPTVFEEYIEDPTNIVTKTIIQSRIVPSCDVSGANAQSAAVPTPSQSLTEFPSVSPIVSLSATVEGTNLAPTPDTTAVALPSVSPVAPVVTPQTDPLDAAEKPGRALTPTSCGEGLMSSETLGCKSVDLDSISVTYETGELGIVRLRVVQGNGAFRAILSASGGVMIRRITGALSTDDSLSATDLGRMQEFGRDVENLSLEIDAFSMPLAKGLTSCCSESLYFYTAMEMCKGEMCEVTDMEIRSTPIQCEDPCSKSKRGTIVPFSRERECATCRA